MTLQDSLDKVSGDMPEVQQHAIDAEAKETEQTIKANEGRKDKQGRAFDASIHKTGADGQPALNADGSLRIKPGWGSPSFNKEAKPTNSRLNVDPVRPMQSGPMLARDTGRQIASTIFALGIAVGGDEWRPIVDEQHGIDEQRSMQEAWGRYCEATGMNDIPPGIALTITMVAYIGPRFAQPKTKARATTAYGWVKNTYIRWQLRRRGIDPDAIHGEAKDDTEAESPKGKGKN
jgi:hypothetical protein